MTSRVVDSSRTESPRWLLYGILALIACVLPQVASAQSIAGVVRDTSGAILPGVTVEAASPALIEKVRTTVSDGTGTYRLENLVPGVYTLTYTLPGFTTVQRTDVELQTGVTVTLNSEMRVGGLQETLTVTGETPVVDVQNSTRNQRVLSDEVVAALPASRGYGNLLAVASGIQANGIQNSGIAPDMIFFTSRGGRSNEGTVQIDGMNVGSAFNGGGVAGYGYDTSGAQEVQLTVAGGLGEADRGGPQFNLIPKTGGNTFSGTYFGNIAGKWSQGDNVDDELRSFGIPTAASIIRSWDTSFSMGGPIVRDKVWFYGMARTFGAYTDIAGRFANANAGDPTRWDYVSDLGVTQRSASSRKIGGVRVTGQLTPKNKVGAYIDYQKICEGSSYAQDANQCRTRGDDWIGVGGFGTWSPEATHSRDNSEKIMQFNYTSTVTSKLLLEAAFSQFFSNWGGQTPSGALDQAPFIPVTSQSIGTVDQATGVQIGVPVTTMVYHGFGGLNNNHQTHNVWRAAASYVTGAHSMKVGYQAAYEVTDIFGNYASHGLQYRFGSSAAGAGLVPNLITQRITPWQQANRTRYDAFYVQDQWTVNRLTLQGALRYEHAWSFFPEGMNGLLADSRFGGPAFTLPYAKGVEGYNDIAPRMGMAYDVFGDGRTAVKVNLSKYFQSAANDGVYIGTNKASTFAQTATRSWTDNGNFNPDCDLNSPLAQDNRATGGDFCGAADPLTFFQFAQTHGLGTATAVSPSVLEGWGVRPYDWQFAASVQQQIVPRVSAEFGYSRRSWGNITTWNGFNYTDNRALTAADFDTFTMTVPTDSRLPNSGETISFPLLKPAAFGRQDNYLTRATDYGDVQAYWQGLELTVNARPNNGLTLQGGFTTGAGTRDNCEVTAAQPELLTVLGVQQAISSCHVQEPWLWAWRGLINYTVPKIDVQVSGILRSMDNISATNDPASNGASANANLVIPNSVVQAALGRPLAGGAQNVTVNLGLPGDVYPERLNTVDMRVSKILRFGRTRSNVGIDLYNLFNANTGTAFNQTFGTMQANGTVNSTTWLRPTSILNARFLRFNATVDF
jgi:Carboxypeptidase regulatory-like domain